MCAYLGGDASRGRGDPRYKYLVDRRRESEGRECNGKEKSVTERTSVTGKGVESKEVEGSVMEGSVRNGRECKERRKEGRTDGRENG